MASWAGILEQAPELAARVRACFDGHKHKVMATLRADGSPRVSGTEMDFLVGEVWLGSMTGAAKARDLLRDPRVAIHCAPIDLKMVGGDAKLSGRAVEVTDPAEFAAFYAAAKHPLPTDPFHLFRLDIDEIVLTAVRGDFLVVESWRDGRGMRRIERK